MKRHINAKAQGRKGNGMDSPSSGEGRKNGLDSNVLAVALQIPFDKIGREEFVCITMGKKVEIV